ncbi:MAG TPA: CDP-diacylglycerol--serine O-phosphatidyltransferase [Gemmatimonadaceae bacterium]|jgi:CDP-diacylglycerol--serine O-phosphatidyltransferase|nr:CDP-diacylglycerol--serine O-phosphatidyltransferase [Gemmatimonadaceae bacterium]
MTARVRRPTIRRAVVYLPNGFTLFNLFCGIFAIVLASRQNFARAALFVFLGGIADALDGRVARATGSGSRMGEELDSLVDAISFGFAPAMIMYFAVLNTENWQWLFVFLYTACAVLRLARFNVEQAGRAKTYFHGLPSPAAGLTLATYYWFSQTPLYNETIILFTDNKTLSELPWHTMLPGLMGLLAVLMVSNVPYSAVPTIGWRSLKQIAASLVLVIALIGAFFRPRQFFFPALLAYVLYGALKWIVLGLIGSRSEPEEIYFQLEPEEELAAAIPPPSLRRTPPVGVQSSVGVTESDGVSPGRRRRRRRRRGDGRRSERPTESEERSPRSDRGERPNRLTPNRPPRIAPQTDQSSEPKPPTLLPPPTNPKDNSE